MKKLIAIVMMLLIATNGYTITSQDFATKEAEFGAIKSKFDCTVGRNFEKAKKESVSKKRVLKIKELLPSVLEFREKELKYLNFKIDFLKAIGDNLELEVTEKAKKEVLYN